MLNGKSRPKLRQVKRRHGDSIRSGGYYNDVEVQPDPDRMTSLTGSRLELPIPNDCKRTTNTSGGGYVMPLTANNVLFARVAGLGKRKADIESVSFRREPTANADSLLRRHCQGQYRPMTTARSG